MASPVMVLIRESGVRPGLGGRRGDLDDVGHIGGKLDDQGFSGPVTDFADHGPGRIRVDTEGHAAGLDIGAGDVDLDAVDARCFIGPGGQGGVFVNGGAVDIDQDRGREPLKKGQFF